MKLSPEEIEAQLAEVRRAYLTSLQEKRDTIVKNWSSLRETWQTETCQSLYLILHSLAGSAETFDLAQVSVDARALVELFRQHDNQRPFAADRLQEVCDGIDRLIASIDAGLAQPDKSR